MASAAAAPAMAREFGSCSGSAESTMRDDLRFVQEPFGEQRPDRPVDQPAGEDFLFRRAPLALDKAARNLAGGVSVFAVIDGEREKSGSRFGLFGHASGDEDGRVPGANDDRAVRLFGHLARFKGNDPAAQIDFNCMNHGNFVQTSNLGSGARTRGRPGQSMSASIKEPWESGADRVNCAVDKSGTFGPAWAALAYCR